MQELINYLNNALNVVKSIGISDVIDILIAAFLFYKAIGIIMKTNSTRLAKGVIFTLLALWLSGVLKLYVINFVLKSAVSIGFLALVILFQPELRRILERVGHSSLSGVLGKELELLEVESAITQTVIACGDMSKSHTGALIVFERSTTLDDQMHTGTIIGADVTAELLKNIFYDKAPLHDGAVIIRDGKLSAAGCILPLSSNVNLSRDLGMRHRAGIGLSEHSDAVVAIVSEESGAVSVAVDGMLKRHLTSETFERILRNELIPDEQKVKKKTSITDIFKVKKNGQQ